MTLGDADPLDIAELVEQLAGASWTKMIGAGSTVAVSLNSAMGAASCSPIWRGGATRSTGSGTFPPDRGVRSMHDPQRRRRRRQHK